MKKRLKCVVCAVGSVLFLNGCIAPLSKPEDPSLEASPTPTKVESPQVSRADSVGAKLENEVILQGSATLVERRFLDGLNLYNEGNYQGAIRIFREPLFERAWPELRIRVLKYLAFSLCVTNNVPQCRNAFGKALTLNPEFNLTPAESGHPIWGVAFKEVRSEMDQGPKLRQRD